MKKFVILFVFSVLFFSGLNASDNVTEQIKAQLISQFKVGNYNIGSKYIIAIPPNETAYFGWADAFIEIHISAKTDAFVKLNILGVKSQTKIAAGDILKIDETMGLNKSTTECREYNLATSKTIIIEADVPVAVSVFNLKSATGEGYSAIPVELWGTSYIHSSYYDYNETPTIEFSGGFLILGSEDDTKVEVTLRGVGDKNLATIKNDLSKSIGDQISFNLDEGEVYQIASDGKTIGEYDLTGTAINSDKPVGVISYHLRTVIPIFMTSSRDNLCEMMSPVKSLSTEYASISFDREGSDKGDLFRIIATEDNTSFSVKWYDLDTKKMINSKSGILKKAGDFQEISSVKSATANAYSITGSSIFQSDKPIMLMQYAYSGEWDGKNYDPFMLSVPAIDQYITHTVIQTPPTSLIDCKLTLIAKVEEGDNINERLNSIMLDGNSLTNTYPTFSTNRIPGTNLYWLRLNMPTGTHYIYGDGIVKFTAFQYGIVKNNNYGFTVAASYKSKFEKDTMKPEITKIGENPNPTIFEFNIKDNRYFEIDEITYKDSQIWFEPLTMLNDEFGFESYNFKQAETEFDWKFEAHDNYNVKLEVEDIYKPASAKFFVADYAGNITIDSVSYTPNLLYCKDSVINFGKIPVKESKEKVLAFVNTSGVDFKIHSILLSNQNNYSIKNIENSTVLKKDDSLFITLDYSPQVISSLDKAMLYIETDNIKYQWELQGSSFEDV